MITGTIELGDWLVTRRVLNKIGEDQVAELLARHQGGDWGDVCEDSREINQQALVCGDTIISLYCLPAGNVLIDTEPDRSATRVFFIEEQDEVWKEQHEQQ